MKIAPMAMALGYFSLCVYAFAIPWELFQRVPAVGGTMTKCAAAGVIAASLLVTAVKRRWPGLTGVEWPVGLLAAASVLSAIHTVDAAATVAQLRLYFMYAALFLAAAHVTHSPETGLRVVTAFVLSAGLLAAYTLCCYAGWFWPADWNTIAWPQDRLLHEFRAGVPLRMAGASPDPNASAMVLVVAFGASLYRFKGETVSRGRSLFVVFIQTLLVAALAVSMSRSALLIAGVLVLFRVLQAPRWRRQLPVAVGILVVAIVALIFVAPALVQTLGRRLASGLAFEDPSMAGRAQVYAIGFHLLHDYGIRGCGLGAIDTALALSRFAPDVVMTVHSMPLALWIELGMLGFIAWAWLWIAIVRACLRSASRASLPAARRHGATFFAMAGAVFGMTLVQPFATSPLYPFVLGIGLGPIAAARRGGAPHAESIGTNQARFQACAAIAVCTPVIVINAASYASTARVAERFADLLEAGRANENASEWESAQQAYSAAAAVAEQGVPLRLRPYWDTASRVVDIPPLFAELGVLTNRPGPSAVATFARARVCIRSGAVDEAARLIDAIEPAQGLLPDLYFDLGEACWKAGAYKLAIESYQRAATIRPAVPTHGDIRRLTRLESRMQSLKGSELSVPSSRDLSYFRTILTDAETKTLSWPDGRRRGRMLARLNALESPTGRDEQLERAALERRLGRWADCVRTCRALLDRDPTCAEAQFIVGVAAQLDGRTSEARLYYEKALEVQPNHYDARVALAGLNGNPVTGIAP